MPSMVTSTTPRGAKLVKLLTMLVSIYTTPSLLSRETAVTVWVSSSRVLELMSSPVGGHAEQGAQGGNQDDTQGEQREQGNGVGQAVARPLDASQYPAEQGRFIFSAFFSHAITSVTYNIVYSVADFR